MTKPQTTFTIVGNIVEQQSKWQPIETAPKDGKVIPCAYRGEKTWHPLCWKTNHRTGLSYFGNPDESDDYEVANNQPTHWFNLPDLPDV